MKYLVIIALALALGGCQNLRPILTDSLEADRIDIKSTTPWGGTLEVQMLKVKTTRGGEKPTDSAP